MGRLAGHIQACPLKPPMFVNRVNRRSSGLKVPACRAHSSLSAGAHSDGFYPEPVRESAGQGIAGIGPLTRRKRWVKRLNMRALPVVPIATTHFTGPSVCAQTSSPHEDRVFDRFSFFPWRSQSFFVLSTRSSIGLASSPGNVYGMLGQHGRIDSFHGVLPP